MDKLIHLFQTMGPFALIPILFVVAGVGMWLNILWGLATGGPRALQAPGAPYLYDRVYYLLWLVLTAGWTFGLLSFVTLQDPPQGFMTGWAIGAIGAGLMLALRGDMIADAMRYKARHGFWLLRYGYDMHVKRWESWNPLLRKLFPGAFVVIGAGVLIFNLPHLPEALRQAETGAGILLSYVTTP